MRFSPSVMIVTPPHLRATAGPRHPSASGSPTYMGWPSSWSSSWRPTSAALRPCNKGSGRRGRGARFFSAWPPKFEGVSHTSPLRREVGDREWRPFQQQGEPHSRIQHASSHGLRSPGLERGRRGRGRRPVDDKQAQRIEPARVGALDLRRVHRRRAPGLDGPLTATGQHCHRPAAA